MKHEVNELRPLPLDLTDCGLVDKLNLPRERVVPPIDGFVNHSRWRHARMTATTTLRARGTSADRLG